jgi:uncharacterized CHY-type Zn-finger protein
MGECFNCDSSASQQYTLTLEDATVLADVLLCGECAADFRTVEWIELTELPASTSH